MPSDPYSQGVLSHDLPTELHRLGLLERALDPETFALLARLRPGGPGGKCLEVGAGAGSVARWLARRYPAGEVVVTDVDTRFLADLEGSNLRVLVHDVTRDDFGQGSFDLVHTRLLLHHLPARMQVLGRAVTWLADGGMILVEEPDFVCRDSEFAPLRRTVRALEQHVAATQGTDCAWARALPRVFSETGLRDVGSQTRLYATSDADACTFWRASLNQIGPALVEHGRVAPTDLEHALCHLAEATDVPLFAVVAAWGTRTLG